jgi:hypothetical protein
MLQLERHAPFRHWIEHLQRERGALIPHFDPADGGIDAEVLFLLEAPGPMTNGENKRPGSGFISIDNDDATAQEVWNARSPAGLGSGTTLAWNIVPWYLGVASVKPKVADLRDGACALVSLMELMPQLHTVVLAGRYAQRGWARYVEGNVQQNIRVIPAWHPSPLAMAGEGRRDQFRAAVVEAARNVRNHR